MHPAIIKDRILLALKNKASVDCENLSKELNLPFETVFTLTKEMEKRGHVQTKSTATIGHSRSLMIAIQPEGKYFIDNISYRKESRRERIEKFPQKYWWLIALGTFLIGLFVDLLKDLIKQFIYNL